MASLETHIEQVEQVERLPGVPLADQLAVHQSRAAERQAQADALGGVARALEDVLDARERELAERLGGERYRKLLEIPRGRPKDVVVQPRPDGSDDEERLRNERRERAEQLIREADIDMDVVREVNARSRDRWREVVEAERKSDGLPPDLDVPPELLNTDAPGWNIHKPPYLQGLMWSAEYVNQFGYYANAVPHNDAAAGLVGHVNSFINADTSELDFADLNCHSELTFTHRTQSAGLLEVLVEAQSAVAHHQLSVFEDWGDSEYDAYQTNYITLRTVSPASTTRVKVPVSSFGRSGDDDNTWDKTYISPGTIVPVRLFSDVSFPAGAFVGVRVGTTSQHSSYSSDMEIYSTMTFNWFIRSIRIRSTG